MLAFKARPTPQPPKLTLIRLFSTPQPPKQPLMLRCLALRSLRPVSCWLVLAPELTLLLPLAQTVSFCLLILLAALALSGAPFLWLVSPALLTLRLEPSSPATALAPTARCLLALRDNCSCPMLLALLA
jgi:hypothetical protein